MTRIIFLSLLAILACTKPPTPSTAAEPLPTSAQPTERPAGMPDLCDLDGGRWCVDCPATGCPHEGKTGALCCSGGFCVEWTGGSCGGILGWCENYTLDEDESTGIMVATCHDV